jgi:hypothetical protein
MKRERLYWHGRLVAPGSIFGDELLQEVEAQRLERQVTQGMAAVVEYKQRREGGGTHVPAPQKQKEEHHDQLYP